MEQEVILKKDKGCRLCVKIFDCAGKPENVKLCLQFEERKQKHE